MKKLLCLALVIVLSVFCVSNQCFAESDSSILLGDINSDKAINAKDLLLMRQYSAEWDVEINQQNSDLNADDLVNTKDIMKLRQYLAGIITVFSTAIDFEVLEAINYAFAADVPALSIVKTRAELEDLFTKKNPDYTFPNDIVPDKRYDDEFFKQKTIIVLADILSVADDRLSVDKLVLDDNLAVYTTENSFAPPTTAKAYTLISVDKQSVENVKALAQYKRVIIPSHNINEQEYKLVSNLPL